MESNSGQSFWRAFDNIKKYMGALSKSFSTITPLRGDFKSRFGTWHNALDRCREAFKSKDFDKAQREIGRLLKLLIEYFGKRTKPVGGVECSPIVDMEQLMSKLNKASAGNIDAIKKDIDNSFVSIKKIDGDIVTVNKGLRAGDNLGNRGLSPEAQEWDMAVMCYTIAKFVANMVIQQSIKA